MDHKVILLGFRIFLSRHGTLKNGSFGAKFGKLLRKKFIRMTKKYNSEGNIATAAGPTDGTLRCGFLKTKTNE